MTGRTLPVLPWLRLGQIERYVLVQQARSLGIALGVIAAALMIPRSRPEHRGPTQN